MDIGLAGNTITFRSARIGEPIGRSILRAREKIERQLRRRNPTFGVDSPSIIECTIAHTCVFDNRAGIRSTYINMSRLYEISRKNPNKMDRPAFAAETVPPRKEEVVSIVFYKVRRES